MKAKVQKNYTLPLKPGVCPECLTEHSTETPHSKDSLFYQCTFFAKNKRWPTWEDASAHCSPQTRQACLQGVVQMCNFQTANTAWKKSAN